MATVMKDEFSFGKPGSGGDLFKAADHVGRLVAFVSPTLEKDVPTKFGESDAVKVRYAVVLDGDDKGAVYEGSLIFGAAMVPAIYANGDSEIVLGRIAVGQAKSGQSAPYILEAADADDEAAAMEFFRAHARRNAAGVIVLGS